MKIPWMRHDGRYEIILYDPVTGENVSQNFINEIRDVILLKRKEDSNFCEGFFENDVLNIEELFGGDFNAEENSAFLSKQIKNVIFNVKYEDFHNPIILKHNYLNGELISFSQPFWITTKVKKKRVESLLKICIKYLALNIKYINFTILPKNLIDKLSHAIAKEKHTHVCHQEDWNIIL